MKLKKSIFYIVSVTVLLALTFGTALADDSTIFRRNISKTPAGETEYASISFMRFTVPAQGADGEPVFLEYTAADLDDDTDNDEVVYTAQTAKPLVASYIDEEHAEETLLSGVSILGGLSIGEFDAFVAHSLDDGATWKTTNLSESAEKSSFFLANGTAYPGDVYSVVQSTIGNRVMAAWLSRYCDEGSPLYTLVDEDDELEYKTLLQETYGLPDMAIDDIWGVAGTQKSVDFTLQGFPEVGEIPYGCVWTARGTLIQTGTATAEDGTTVDTHDIVWTKPERLTSGVRDPNRLEIDGVEGAGFAITWQEDPEGLRPGLGLGPGEGWSGAIVNAKTDIWYSYISWEDYNLIGVDGDYEYGEEITTIEDYFLDDAGVLLETLETNKPKVVVPMAMPVRLTDNNMCLSTDKTNTTGDDYCFSSFDFTTGTITEMDEAGYVATDADFCASSVTWTTPDGQPKYVCKAADGRVLNGRIGASRARMTLQPYTKPDGSKGAWFIMAYEESKALGEYLLGGDNSDTDPIDIGKNIWYHTFDLLHPEVVQQGGMLNQPSIYNPELDFGYDGAYTNLAGEVENLLDGITLDDFLTLPEPDQFGNTIYETEIARRFSLVAQPAANMGQSRTVAYLLYKQGTLNQGGPADIFARRIVVPTDFDPTVDNPYAYSNMDCGSDGDLWFHPTNTDGSINPRYLQGFCGAPATNLSGTTIEGMGEINSGVTCYVADDPSACSVDFPWDETVEVDQFPKVAEWSQSGEYFDGTNMVLSNPYDGVAESSNLDDQSWENPYDVAKGHRGFLDGDFLFIMYAWSPNWKSNSVGNDKYNLYVRRSFDGGETWTTTPAEDPWYGEGLTSTEGTLDPSLCENYGIGGKDDDVEKICYGYGAGEFEMARNVSQLTGTKVTILDPRYTPSGGIKKFTLLALYENAGQIFNYEIPLHEQFDDINDGKVGEILDRDSSKFFVVYETGDNTTAAEGEPTPLDLFYSQATNYGDLYEWYDVEDGAWTQHEELTYGTTLDEDYRWPWLEKDQEDLSGEAALTASPSGDFLYADWSQWREDEYENIFDSDIWFRRLFYSDVDTLPQLIIQDPPLTAMFDTDQEFVLNALAVDFDQFGEGSDIVEYEWSVDSNIRTDISGSRFNAPPRTLSNGWHTFSVRAKDNDGKWSKPAYVRVLIVDEIHTTFLPLMKR